MSDFLDLLANDAGTIGLVFFFVFFLMVLASVLRPGAKAQAEMDGRIPLMEADDEEQRHHD